MLKFKKLMTLTLVTVLASAFSLTGCSDKEEATNTNTGQTTNLIWYTIGTPQKDTEKVQAELNKYLKEKINTTVEIKQVDWGDYSKKMQVVINSGEDYDICFTCSWANDYLPNARRGAFASLDDLLEKYGKETKSAVDQRFWDGAKIDGKTYAIPTNKEIGVAPMFVFTKEYVDKYNIPYKDIHTLQDLEPWLKLIKEKEPDVVPFYTTKDYSVPVKFDKIVDPVGIFYTDKSLKAANLYETEEMKKQLETMRKYYLAGYINKDAATTSDNKAVKRFVTKGDGQPFAESLWGKDLGYPVVASPIMDTYITNGSTTGAMQAISANSKNKEKAMQFLNLMNTDKYVRNILNYGIEGTHYEKISDNKIKLLPESKQYQVPYFSLGNLYKTYLLDGDPDNKWDEFKKFNDASIPAADLGFNFDTTPVNTEVAGLKNVLEEFGPALNTGSVDPNEFLPKLNEKLKSAGIDKIVKEMQSQADKWKK